MHILETGLLVVRSGYLFVGISADNIEITNVTVVEEVVTVRLILAIPIVARVVDHDTIEDVL
jgi:hypothetical protein